MPGSTPSTVRWPVLGGGIAVVVLIGVFALTIGRPSPAPGTGTGTGNPADSLIGLWIDSAGGMETYHQFQTAQFTIATILYDTLSGRIMRNRPRYAWIKKGPLGEETRVERWETDGFIEQGFNGETAWALLNGSALPDTAKDAREALYVARDLFYWMGLPFKLTDPGVILTYHGMTSRPGLEFRADPNAPGVAPPENAYHAVGVSFDVGVGEHRDAFTYYFSPGVGFPVEVTYVEEGRTNINRVLWGETGRGGAIDYPYPLFRDFISESGKRTKALAIYDVVMNGEIHQAQFERPTP